MNLLIDSTKLQPNEYQLLVNGRVRYDKIQVIKKPLELELGLTNVQGIYSASNLGVLFADGQLYVKDYNNIANNYTNVAAFSMDANVDRIYAALVPASYMNYSRESADGTPSGAVSFNAVVNGTPQALIAQDGINQPKLVFPDGTCRDSQNYNQWNMTDREYVPIGKDMVYSKGKLYVLTEDNTLITHSITGRPLDFMVVVDGSGNKLPTESEGGAARIAHRVSYESLTCLAPTTIQEGGLYAANSKQSFLVIPDETDLFFGEPQFNNVNLFPTGALNSFSLVDILGDTAFIDSAGITSFNAVLQLKNEGRNAPFSAKVAPLFEDIDQGTTAAINFDNYALFALTTIHGPAVLVYDTLIQQYVSLDIYAGVAQIKQFAVIKTANERVLVFITEDNKVYEHYRGATVETTSYYLGEFSSENPKNSHKLDVVNVLFSDIKESGPVTVQEYSDRFAGGTVERYVNQTTLVEADPVPLPFNASNDRVNNKVFPFRTSKLANKIGVYISWAFDACLIRATMNTSDQAGRMSLNEVAESVTVNKAGAPVLSSFAPTSGALSTVVTLTGTNLFSVNAVRFNGTAASFAALSDTEIRVTVPSGATTGKLELVTSQTTIRSETDFTVIP